MSLVKWHQVCQPKDKGGLGYRSLKECNKGFLLKIAWHTLLNKNALWSKILYSKYLTNNGYIPSPEKKSNVSVVWQGVTRVWPKLLQCIEWKVSNGKTIRFWTNAWFGDQPLINHAIYGVSEEEKALPVSAFVLPN